MKSSKMILSANSQHSDLEMIIELVYAKCGFELTNLKPRTESLVYGACSFELDGRRVEYRASKITPTKNGQFVTVWKRDPNGVTVPFDSSDDIDFMVISSRSGGNIGQFIFPKAVLIENGIISRNGKGGKRGMRVYPPWDTATSKQAVKTQSWQTKYFISIQNDDQTAYNLVRRFIHSD